jgi:Homeodomain-like domain
VVHPVSIVWPCPLDVDAYVERGHELEVPRPPCPLCAGPTGRWSGYERHLRGERDRLIWIPRVRCGSCEVTQALLPWFVVNRRWDEVEVIGRALELAAEGWGHRRIARVLGRPETTVRDWCRRLRERAEPVAELLLARAASCCWRGRRAAAGAGGELLLARAASCCWRGRRAGDGRAGSCPPRQRADWWPRPTRWPVSGGVAGDRWDVGGWRT